MRCYSSAKKLVESGGASWEELAALGMVQLDKDAFTAEFEKRKKA